MSCSGNNCDVECTGPTTCTSTVTANAGTNRIVCRGTELLRRRRALQRQQLHHRLPGHARLRGGYCCSAASCQTTPQNVACH